MTARRYNTDQWTPATFVAKERLPIVQGFVFRDIKFRHILFFMSVILFVVSPILWLMTGQYSIALISVGAAGILFGFSALLVPSQLYNFNDDCR